MTVHEAIATAQHRITHRDAATLLQAALPCDRAWLLAHPDAELSEEQAQTFWAWVERRHAHWPLQYLVGSQEFFGLELQVTPAVLIPRPETELLVEAVLRWTQAYQSQFGDRRPHLVDVGTGSGAIALALAKHLPLANITALDLSPAALAVAERNAQLLALPNPVRFYLADLLELLDGQAFTAGSLDAVVSNPPYVPVGDAAGLQPEVRDFEPSLALFAGEDGLEIYRRLLPQAWAVLRPGGLLALEFGFGQQPALAELLHRWTEVSFSEDYAGIPRTALARKP